MHLLDSYTSRAGKPMETFGLKGAFTTLLTPGKISVDAHLQRLLCHAAQMGVYYSQSRLQRQVYGFLSRFSRTVRVRVMLSEVGLDCFAFEHHPRPRSLRGVCSDLSRDRPRIKSLNYQSVLAEIRSRGVYVEPLLLSSQECLLEGATTNLIFVAHHQCFLPKGDYLFGLGLQHLLCRLVGEAPRQIPISIHELGRFSEILWVNSIQGVGYLENIEDTEYRARSRHWYERLSRLW